MTLDSLLGSPPTAGTCNDFPALLAPGSEVGASEPKLAAGSRAALGMFDALITVEWHLGHPGGGESAWKESRAPLARMCVLGGVVDAIHSAGYSVHLEPLESGCDLPGENGAGGGSARAAHAHATDLETGLGLSA
jgi:hypothetical protein